jgi:hypothetical protein
MYRRRKASKRIESDRRRTMMCVCAFDLSLSLFTTFHTPYSPMQLREKKKNPRSNSIHLSNQTDHYHRTSVLFFLIVNEKKCACDCILFLSFFKNKEQRITNLLRMAKHLFMKTQILAIMENTKISDMQKIRLSYISVLTFVS